MRGSDAITEKGAHGAPFLLAGSLEHVPFLTTPFAGGRHERRVQKIMALERGPDR